MVLPPRRHLVSVIRAALNPPAQRPGQAGQVKSDSGQRREELVHRSAGGGSVGSEVALDEHGSLRCHRDIPPDVPERQEQWRSPADEALHLLPAGELEPFRDNPLAGTDGHWHEPDATTVGDRRMELPGVHVDPRDEVARGAPLKVVNDICACNEFGVRIEHIHVTPRENERVYPRRLKSFTVRESRQRRVVVDPLLDHERIEDRFGRVTICSGDGIFAPSAARLAGAEVEVVVVSLDGHLAARLELAANSAVLFSPTESVASTGSAS